jgi:hypothetical protein
MKLLSNIAGGLLGFIFLFASLVVLLHVFDGKMPLPVPGSPEEKFMGAVGPTGYMTFIKVCELIGGTLVAIPRLRNLGLLILGPILVNILAFGAFVATDAAPLKNPLTIVAVICALFLLYVERKAFAHLVTRS